MSNVIKSIKVRLSPNNKQKTKLFEYANVSRFAYNWTIARERDNYCNGNKFLNDGKLRKEFTQMKKMSEYKWLSDVSCDVPKQAIKDACTAYKRFFDGCGQYPRFKSKKKSKLSFYQDNFKIQFTDKKVFLSGIGFVKLCEKNKFPIGKGKTKEISVMNPRVTFDGLHWYISVSIECEHSNNISQNEGIGIDLGIKDLAVCSDGNVYKNINKTQKVKSLEKKKRRLQRSISRKYEKNKKGESYCKTSNIIKSEKELLKLNHRLTNIRQNYLHQITSEIIKRKPSFICIEDLNVKGMMKNKYLSKAVQGQCFYEFRRQVEYKSAWNNIPFVIADRWFPSSKLCNCCGAIKKDLKLSDRIYICECGNIIDRDYQAALNLKNYGENVLKQSIS